MKAHQRLQARDLYFNSGKNFEDIAKELGVHPRTLYRWAREEAWDKFKQAALQPQP